MKSPRATERLPAGQTGAEDRRLRVVGARARPGKRVLADGGDDRLSRSGRSRATTSRMSAVWLPWPGKRIAVVVLIR